MLIRGDQPVQTPDEGSSNEEKEYAMCDECGEHIVNIERTERGDLCWDCAQKLISEITKRNAELEGRLAACRDNK